MAEILGTVTSILQLLNTAVKAWEHIQDFRNAPKEEKQIRLEMDHLEAMLKRLRKEMTANPSSQLTQNIPEPLTNFEGMMKEFTPKLGALTFSKQVKWTLGGRKEAAEYLAKFEQFKSLVNVWLLVDLGDISRQQSALLGSVKSGVTNLNNIVIDQQQAAERTKIIDWFSPINFFQQHADITSARQKETGGWLMMDPCFQEWKEGLGRTLWCHGIPGAGKTVLASVVVDHLLSQGPTARTACIYLNHKETKVQTPANLLASIWRQLVLGGRDISEVKTLYQKHSEKQTTPSLAEIVHIVHIEIGSSKVYIVLDAVDEYPEDLRQILLPALAAMGPTCSLMITSRPHITPSPAFQNIKFLEIHANMDDIQAYVNMEIKNSPHLSKYVQKTPALMEEIHTRISDRVDGMFLLAKLHMKALTRQRTAAKVWSALDNLPQTLVETYADAMKRIDTQSEEDRQIAQAVLTWVTHAKQILSVAELRVALAIEPGAKELDDENLLDIETILGVCAGLIIVDQHLSVVRLVHYTTQEYMDSISLERFPGAQTKITQSLLTFLSFDSVWNQITGRYWIRLKLPPLLRYCQYCLTHAAGEPEKDSELQPIILKFIQRVPLWAKFAGWCWDQWRGTQKETSPLVVAATTNLLVIAGLLIEEGQYSENMVEELASAAASGHCDMVKLLVNSGASVNAKGGAYRNALQAAADNGSKEIVQLLLEHGAEVNVHGGVYSNALQAAAVKGHKEIVQLLIEHGAEVNVQGGLYGNALQAAAHGGYKEIVQLLVDHGAEVNAQGGAYWNALQAAAVKGHKEIVQLLIEHGAEVNAQSGDYGNALQSAAGNGSKEIVQLLIEHGAEVNGQDGQYGDALQTAAANGSKEIVQLLLEHGAEANAQGGEYGNALQAAAHGGYKEVVQLLVDHGAEVNAHGGVYRNALQAAADNGSKEIVQLLIEHGAEVNGQDGQYGNVLHTAAAKGSKEIVQLLVDCGAEVNAQDGQYGNALYFAAEGGNKEIVQLLLEHGADTNAQGGWLGNALQAAAVNGYKEIVQLLLEHGAEVNAQGGVYGNALQATAHGDHKDIVQLLIEHGAEVNAQNGDYSNALQSAAQNGSKEIVQLLIEHGAEVNAQIRWFGNALQAAAVGGNKEIVHLLLEHGAEANAQGGEYGNALQAAARGGYKEVVQLLVDYGAEVNAHGGAYGNALQAAAHGGDKEIVQLLIEHGAEVNAQGGDYSNALQAAAVKRSKEIVQLLIKHRAEVNAQGGQYGNALQAAAHGGNKEIVDLLIKHRAEVNAQGGEYGNALQAAAHGGHRGIVKLLIWHGAEVNAQGGMYGNALQAAAQGFYKEVVQLLVDHGADMNDLAVWDGGTQITINNKGKGEDR
ncbi:ankyrin repeat-containing domain protein [Mycena filopes]|nr:ankyrin repeat-containing domain protein [Mycena filopes]